MINKSLLRYVYICVGLASTLPTFAEIIVTNPNPGLIPSPPDDNVANGIGKIIEYFVGVASVMGVIGITWGGIQMMFSAGDEEKMKKARWMMIYSIIGTAVAGCSYGIIYFVGNVSL